MTGNQAKRAERERYMMDWVERERMEMWRENDMGFKRGQHWLILTNGLNQHMGFFGYRKQPYQHIDIFVHGKQSNQT